MINVMYAADDNYAEIMGVSILSLIENNMEENLRFFLIEDKISEKNLVRLKKMIEGYKKQVVFIKKPNIRQRLGVELKTLRWSDSAYSRLFLKELFSEYPKIEKILYLDCDTLIVGKIKPLWEVDISEQLGAACFECMSNMHKRIIGAKKTDNYLNTGMLLLNVKRWIEEDIENLVSNFIREYNGKTEYVDQGVINGTISNQFKIVSPRYNLTALAYDFTYEEMQIYRKPQFGYSKVEWEEAIKNPVVVHFTTSFLSIRPWYEGSKHPYAKEWKAVHDRTPWKDVAYRELKNRVSRDRKERLYYKLPRCLAVHIAGFLHAYVKPIVYVVRGWV